MKNIGWIIGIAVGGIVSATIINHLGLNKPKAPKINVPRKTMFANTYKAPPVVKKDNAEHPTAEHPKLEDAKSEHPKPDEEKPEHPSSEHPKP